MVFVRLDGTIGSWDRKARDMFGHRPEDVLGLPFFMLFVPECRDAVDEITAAAPAETARVRATALDKEGVRFEAEITPSPALAVRNGEEGLVEVVRDVTERSAVEAGLVACSSPDAAAAMRALGEALSPWIPFVDLTLAIVEDDRCRYVHREGFAAATALDEHDLQARRGPVQLVVLHGRAVLVQDTRARVFRVDSRLAARGIGSYAVMPLVAYGRVFATLNVGFRETGMATLRIVRLLAAVADAIAPPLSRTIEFEEKSHAVWRLEQLDRREKEFLALIAHDMRTPLAVIAGSASRLREKWDDLTEDERLEGLDAILRNGSTLTRLVEQDLQLALIETGELPYQISAFDLGLQLKRVVDDFALTGDPNFTLRIDQPLTLVRGDEQRNRQILGNLLSNAVKFSPPGALVEIDVFQRGPMAEVSVRDHGPGISRRASRKLFQKFSRVGAPGALGVPGTGVGLYLARRMVESQGGRIWVKSRLGEGSTFSYTLPLAQTAEAIVPARVSRDEL